MAPTFSPPEPHPDEAARLRSLDSLQVLDTEPEADLDAIVRAASLVCGVPIALISLVDANRQWFKARHGLAALETPRDISFCGHAILGPEIFEVDDATQDIRFAQNPLVTGDPEIRFYAGVPLQLSDGSNIGTLCVIDRVARHLTDTQREILKNLSIAATRLLEKNSDVIRARQWKQRVEQENAASIQLATVVRQSSDAIITKNLEGRVTSWNKAAEQIFGYTAEEMLGRSILTLFPDNLLDQEINFLARLQRGERITEFETQRKHKSGALIHVSVNLSPLYDEAGRLTSISKIVRDISVRIAAQADKEAADARYKQMIDVMYEGVVVQSADGTILSCNQSAERVLGLSYEQMIGLKSVDPNWRCVHADMTAWSGQTHPAMMALASGEEIRDALMGVYKPDGALTWISINAKPLFEPDSARPTSVICTFVDITNRKVAEDAVRKSEATFSAMFNNAPNGMAILSPTGAWLKVNRAMCDLFGYRQEELLRLTFTDVTHPDERDIDMVQIQRLAQGSIHVHQRRKRYIHSSGHTVWGVVSVAAVRDANGQAEFLVSQVLDFTEQKRIELELQRGHDLLEKLSAQVPGVLFQLSLSAGEEPDVPFVSSACLEMFGLTQDALRQDARSLFAAVVAEDRVPFTKSIVESAQTLRDWTMEFRVELPGGQIRWRHGQARPERQHDGSTLWHGFIADATERVEARLQLQEINQSLERHVQARTKDLVLALQSAEAANRSRAEFLANTSHEIRTPMNSVLGMAYLALQTNTDPQQRMYLQKIQRSGAHLMRIIDDILDISKIDAGKIELVPAPFSLDDTLEHLMHLIEGRAHEKGLSLHLHRDAQAPALLYGDAMRVEQIVLNFVGNAIKFTEHGSVSLRLKLVELNEKSCLLRFEVQDSGIGLTQAEIPRLFRSFEQADNSITRKFGGTGLGLAISKQLAQLMGGDVGVDSEPSKGSTFWFQARFDLAKEVNLPTASGISLEQARDALRGKSILVVDDNEFNLDVASGLLEVQGCVVSTAVNGLEALNRVRAQKFDCVLMDVQMPVMDGLEATRQIRADRAVTNTLVLGMTANASGPDRVLCLQAGMVDVIKKPVEPEKMFVTIVQWLQKTIGDAAPPIGRQSAQQTASEKSDFNFDNVTVWDPSALPKIIGRSPGAANRLLTKYLSTARTTLNEVLAAVEGADWANASRLGHKLKSPSRSVGAMRLGTICEAMEVQGKAANANQCRQIAIEMQAAFAAVQERIDMQLSHTPD